MEKYSRMPYLIISWPFKHRVWNHLSHLSEASFLSIHLNIHNFPYIHNHYVQSSIFQSHPV